MMYGSARQRNTGQLFANAVKELLGVEVKIEKRSELDTFVVMPQHWVVERSVAWIAGIAPGSPRYAATVALMDESGARQECRIAHVAAGSY